MAGFRVLISISLGGFLLLGSASAGADDLPPEAQADVLLRALSFDRSLEERSGDSLRVLVVHDGEPESERRATAQARAFENEAEDSLLGLPVEAEAVAFATTRELLKRVRRGGIGAIFLDESATAATQSVLQVTRAARIPSLGCTREMAERGTALGVTADADGEPRLLVNLRAAEIEALRLEPRLLQLAEIVE